LRGLAVTSAERSAQLPAVPTFAESGVPGYDVTGWYGLCTQSKVPQPILDKLHADANKVLAGPLRKRFEDQGVTITAKTPDQFAAHVKAEIAKWTKVVAEAKLEGD
jgi:tripartite-type tricarboxylate transporter receptor subunit TctC